MISIKTALRGFALPALAVVCLGAASQPALAQSKAIEIAISVKANKFEPAEVEAPANTPIVFRGQESWIPSRWNSRARI